MSYFNSFPTSHLDSTLLLFNLIINIAAKVILLKCKSDHINLQPPVFLPGEFHGQRSLADYSRTESDATERLTLSLSLSSDGFLYRDTACSHLYKLSILISYGPQSPGSHWLFDAPHTHTCVSTWAFTHTSPLTSSKSLLKCHFLCEDFPCHSIPLCFIFLCCTPHHVHHLNYLSGVSLATTYHHHSHTQRTTEHIDS